MYPPLDEDQANSVTATSLPAREYTQGVALLHLRGGSKRLQKRLLCDTIQLGPERTFLQDPEYSIRLLVDVAIRALSPAINSLRTTVQLLEQIEGCREVSEQDRH
jgi:uncharacterized membrane protein